MFAWAVLGWNLVVVLWGALVRATGSGAGCGSHWPLCNGDVIPRAPAVQTIIEFTHRATSGVALIGVGILVFWAFRSFAKGHIVRTFATVSLVLILLEALLGAGLVLLQYVEQNASIGRAIYLSAHLANTQLLLGALALTAWFSKVHKHDLRFALGGPKTALLLPVMLIVGISGAIAALGDTLFPATSFAEGVRQEMTEGAHFLLRLRIFHPALAIFSAAYASFIALEAIRNKRSEDAVQLAWLTWGLVAFELVVGAFNVVLLAPVWMQLFHLLMADILWVLLVLLVVEHSGTRQVASIVPTLNPQLSVR
ncbi:MAG: COX15/CtaA family protein [Bryobacteraceae bacterium]|nr:COX15/CtaA family protein [Bryobacteraceae bacterium]